MPHSPLGPSRHLLWAHACSVAVCAAALAGAGALAALPAASASAPSSAGPTATAHVSPKGSESKPCRFRPNDSNTGARGELRERRSTNVRSGTTLENVHTQNLMISGSDVTVRNVRVDGIITITGERVRLRRVTAATIYVSSGTNVSVKRSKIEDSIDDAIHVSSDRDRLVRDVKLRYNFVHRPVTPSENHYDGIQVRGVDGLSITCTTFRAGRYHDNFNAAVFLENANGGSANVVVDHNWMFGWAFSIMVDSPSATFTDNRIGGDIKWGPCLLLESSGSGGFRSSGNTWARTGKKVNFCGQG